MESDETNSECEPVSKSVTMLATNKASCSGTLGKSIKSSQISVNGCAYRPVFGTGDVP